MDIQRFIPVEPITINKPAGQHAKLQKKLHPLLAHTLVDSKHRKELKNIVGGTINRIEHKKIIINL
jgi:hypothetical protein